jgi:hypothetical protein
MILVALWVQIFDQAIEHLNSRDVTFVFGRVHAVLPDGLHCRSRRQPHLIHQQDP